MKVFKKSDSDIENQQEVVPIENHTDDENHDFESNIRALPISSNHSQLMRKTLGSLMSSKKSSKIEQNDS